MVWRTLAGSRWTPPAGPAPREIGFPRTPEQLALRSILALFPSSKNFYESAPDASAIKTDVSITEATFRRHMILGANSSSSKSAVEDADYAQESANLASAQTRNQGAKVKLAQANTDQELTFKLIEDWL